MLADKRESIMLHALMYCPPMFGIMGSDRTVVEVAMAEEGRELTSAEIDTILDQYYVSAEVPGGFKLVW